MCLSARAQEPGDILKGAVVYPLNHFAEQADDSTEFSFLKVLLKDKRIVLLGEQSHGDGATFAAKVRLVKFLHSELGFDMLSFESGLYANYKAAQELNHTEARNSPMLESVFPIWSETAEFLPLIQYAHD